MLLILWLLSQYRVMALCWKHSGIIKLPGDTKMLIVQQATTYDFSLKKKNPHQKNPTWTYWWRIAGIKSSSIVNSTKLSNAMALSQFILSDLAKIIKLPWFLKEKHIKVMSWLCISYIYLFGWKKMLTNSFKWVYEIELQVQKYWELLPGVYIFYTVLILLIVCLCILYIGTLFLADNKNIWVQSMDSVV